MLFQLNFSVYQLICFVSCFTYNHLILCYIIVTVSFPKRFLHPPSLIVGPEWTIGLLRLVGQTGGRSCWAKLVVSLISNIQVGSVPAVSATCPKGVPSSPMGMTVAEDRSSAVKGQTLWTSFLESQLLTIYEKSRPSVRSYLKPLKELGAEAHLELPWVKGTTLRPESCWDQQ